MQGIIIYSGNTHSAKTTSLTLFNKYATLNTRIISLEDTKELHCPLTLTKKENINEK